MTYGLISYLFEYSLLTEVMESFCPDRSKDWTLNPKSFGPECWRAAQQAQAPGWPGGIGSISNIRLGNSMEQWHCQLFSFLETNPV